MYGFTLIFSLSLAMQPTPTSVFNGFAHKWIYKLVNSKLQRDNFYSLLSTILLNLLLFFKCVFFEDKVKHEFCNIKKNTTVLFMISSVASFHLWFDLTEFLLFDWFYFQLYPHPWGLATSYHETFVFSEMTLRWIHYFLRNV